MQKNPLMWIQLVIETGPRPKIYFWKRSIIFVTVIEKKAAPCCATHIFHFLVFASNLIDPFIFSMPKISDYTFLYFICTKQAFSYNIYWIRFNLQFSLFKRIIRLELKLWVICLFIENQTCKSDQKVTLL